MTKIIFVEDNDVTPEIIAHSTKQPGTTPYVLRPLSDVHDRPGSLKTWLLHHGFSRSDLPAIKDALESI